MSDSLLSPLNTCQSCGAGAHNNYKHYGDCIDNLETVDLVPYWNLGWNARVQAGDGDFPIPNHLPDRCLNAWGMGMCCAAHMLRQGHTLYPRSNVHRWNHKKAA